MTFLAKAHAPQWVIQRAANSLHSLILLIVLCLMPAMPCWAQPEPMYRGFVTVHKQPAEQSPHLYFFTSDGCAPCRQVEPGIRALIQEGYPVTVVKVNRQPELADRFGITQTPTVVMIANNKMVGRHAGLIDGVTLKKWFVAVGMPNGSRFADRGRDPNSNAAKQTPPEPINTKVVFDRVVDGVERGQTASNYATPTMHRGTRRASNEAEQRALQATVRLKLSDTQSSSYATGTVIHTHGNESLVITCGHVFRDSNGEGVLTAEYGFYDNPQRASAKLIHFDAGPHDVALVAIRTPTPIQPVRIASPNQSVPVGLDIFSIGCDRGDDPTIRHSKIKAKAAYDASPKYDIFGRPVVGRSGGGLFTQDGALIGLCNSCAVEVDEGIYTSLSTLHLELNRVGLAHLFPEDATLLAATSGQDRRPSQLPERFADSRYAEPGFQSPVVNEGRRPLPDVAATLQPFRDSQSPSDQGTFTSNPRPRMQAMPSGTRPTGPQPDDDTEVLILVRSKSDPSRSKTISIQDPTPQLVDYLERMK